MKQNIKRSLCVLIASVMLFAAFPCVIAPAGADASAEGVSFASSADTLRTENAVSEYPLTFEAMVKVPTSLSTRAGAVISNYINNQNSGYGFEIYSSGHPRLYIVDNKRPNGASSGDFSTFDFNFSLDVRSDTSFVHVAITVNKTGTQAIGKCYINGTLRATITKDGNPEYLSSFSTGVGGDNRSANEQYFKGKIAGAAIYSDVRTDAEIASDAAAFDFSDADCIAGYDFTVDDELPYFADLSGNSNNLLKNLASYKQTLNLASRTLDTYPKTLEAKIRIPSSVSSTTRLGAIYGNYCTGEEPSFSFEIYSNGQPRLYYWDAKYKWGVGSSALSTVWDNVNLIGYYKNSQNKADLAKQNRWMDLAITIDEENLQAECFVDGVSIGTKSLRAMPCDGAVHNRFGVGGDLRSESLGVNSTYFRGELANVRVWSNTRTASQIAADAAGVNDSDPNLVAHYDLYNGMEDLSARGADLKRVDRWLDSVEALEPYSYSFAVVGDTQRVASHDTDKLHYIYDWILDNASAMNTKYVFSMGDITNNNTDAEWTECKTQLMRLAGVIPFNVLRGNHDGSAKLNEYFASETAYTSQFGGFYEDGKVEDSWCRFDVGDVKYLVVTLNYGPDDDELAWACSAVEQFPECRVIVVTHGYLFRDGTTLDENDHYPPSDPATDVDSRVTDGNDGEGIWNKFVKKYANIGLVLCGHDPYDRVIKSEAVGDNGNIVTQILVDFQYVDNTSEGPTGMVTMLHFNADGDFVQTESYSTIKGKYFLDDNRFDMTLDWQTDAVPPRYDVSDFKPSSDPASWTCPEKDGKKFSGWYSLSELSGNYLSDTGKAYAKFVNEDVMKIKAQERSEGDTYRIRFVSTVDCLDYTNVGFEVRINGGAAKVSTSTKVYSSLIEDGVTRYAPYISGDDDSSYVTYCVLKGIPKNVTNASVSVKSFWTTTDGTKVYGPEKIYTLNTTASAITLSVA